MSDQPDYSRYVPPQQQRSSRTWLYVLIGVLAACLCCIIVVVAVVAAGGAGFMALFSEAQSLTVPLDSYMRAMSEKDEETALMYFADGSAVSPARLRQQFEGADFALYDKYESATATSFHTNSDAGGTTAEISGTISYSDGSTGTFEATLRKQGNDWKLVGMPNIDVPPSKVQDYLDSQP